MRERTDLRALPVCVFGAAAAACAVLAAAAATGGFEALGLPAAVTFPRAGAYCLMAAGWAALVLAAWHRRPGWAWAGYFLAGMCFWDLVTTVALQGPPMPPGRSLWGPFAVLALVTASRLLHTMELKR